MSAPSASWWKRVLVYGLVVFVLVLAALALVLWVGSGTGDVPLQYDGFDR